jgi:hypothetical protein
MKMSKDVVMNLSMKDGEIGLVLEQTTVRTKSEALALAMEIKKWSRNLPDRIAAPKPKPKSSRPTASRSRPSRAANANASTAQATAD